MKKMIFTIQLTFSALIFYGQTPVQNNIQTKEITIPYSNGREIFHICASTPQIKFDDKKEYFWYTEFSKIKSTKGGCGGDLLHGNYKFYDKKGNMRTDKNYFLGIPEGSEKIWDSTGNITSQTKYNKGEIVYMKYKDEKNNWIEYNGPLFQIGTITKYYSQYNSLISESTMMSYLKQHIKTYYDSGKLQSDYTGEANNYYGKYTEYYENGKIQTQGEFYNGDIPITIRTGTWTYFKSDGTIDIIEHYKVESEKYSNGEVKYVGGYILNEKNNQWLKNGEWRWFKENGEGFLSNKYYEFGEEITTENKK